MTNRMRMAALVAVGIAGSVSADTVRPLLTKENKFPDPGKAEVGTLVSFIEFDDENEDQKLVDANQWIVTPFVRWQAAEKLALRFDVPFGGFEPDVGDSEEGLGDIALGVELKVYEEIFRFPYVIPHATVFFDTGEEDAMLGDGENSLKLGVTLGSTVYDKPVHFAFDVNYEIFEDAENILGGAVSAIWDVSPEFALLVEAGLTDEDLQDEGIAEHPAIFRGGMIYAPNDDLTLGLYGAGRKNAKEDIEVTVRLAYDI